LGYKIDEKVVELKRELQSIKINLRKSDEGPLLLCSKDDIRKEIGRSPDYTDALALTFSNFKDKIVLDESFRAICDEDTYRVETMEGVDVYNLL
jgi:hypothetical protein